MSFFKRHARNIFRTGILLLMVFSMFVAVAWAETTQGQTTPAKIVAVLHCNYEPVSFWDKEADKPYGFFVDILDAIARNNALQVQYICKNGWPDMIRAVEDSEGDLTVLLKSNERERKLLFSTPIDMTYLSFFVRSQSSADPYKVPAAGYTVGVVKGSMSNEQLKLRSELHLLAQNSYEEGIFKLLAGEIDLFAGEDTSILKAAREAGLDDRIKKVGKPFVERERGIAVQKNNFILLELLNRSLADFVGNPEYQRIYIKWYGAPAPFWTFYRILSTGGILLFIVVCGMVFWRYQSITKINAALKLQIAERKQVEEEFIKSETRYRSLFEDSRDAIYISSWDGKFIDVNQAMLNLFGYTREEMLRLNVLETYLSHAEREAFQLEIEDKKAVKDYEIQLIRKDGTSIDCLVTATLRQEKEGTILGYQGIIRDISDKKRLEDQLRQSQKMEAIGIMAGGIAHDFNNIIGIILGSAEIALYSIPEEDSIKHNIDQIVKASHRAKSLVKQILAFSRRDTPNKKSLYLCRLVDENMQSLRSTIPTTVEIKINIPAKCRDNITECYKVLVDPTQIQQLLMNLCINAVQAMDEKGVLEISVDEKNIDDERTVARLGLKPGTYEYLSISDTGSGMSPEIVKQIFDPFFTTKEVGKGTGMGLSVVHGIIENHNGKIFVDSVPGKGTIFHMYFPVVETKPEETSKEIEHLPVGSERVLFVDDEEMIVEIWPKILTRQGYKVTTCSDSAEALETFRSAPDSFDLVITDQTMPKMSGAELAVELLKIRPDIPIVLCTGYSTMISEEKAREIGIRGFCIKPFDKIQLAKAIKKVLDNE